MHLYAFDVGLTQIGLAYLRHRQCHVQLDQGVDLFPWENGKMTWSTTLLSNI